MKNIAIAGAGGFGRETAWLIRQINLAAPTWNLIGYYDDQTAGGTVDELPVLGNLGSLNHITEPLGVVISIADPRIRKRIYEELSSPHVHYPSLFHPACDKGNSKCSYGKGCIITNGCILTVNVTVDDFVIINLGTSVGHDVKIGRFSSIMPDCSLSGFATVGEECQIGSGVRILPGISIGSGSVVGAGAVVTKDFGPKSRLIGVPAVNIAEHVERI
jgi:sugar O-acyltransferase (sialic acid O-acetyltransferase NeuD family)